MENISNSARIAKNTILLYLRTLLVMGISIYTSRIILDALGVEDFGIYTVVGGIVAILAFLNTSMASATQRFLNYELGRGDQLRINLIFSTAQRIHLYIALVLFLLSETIGVWFLNNYMNIPIERIYAANWVFQCSIFSFVLTVISVPYNAAIISHEKMSAYAYISIVEVLLKLLIVYLVIVSSFDKLITYAVLTLFVAAIIRLLYSFYCGRHFEECKKFSLAYEKETMKKMLSFSGWTIAGALGSISHTQGIAIVMNIFFGAVVNAAQGIATQLTNVVNQFVTNFMTALNPQIVKTYATHQMEDMYILLQRGCRIGICLVSLFALPLTFEAPFVLSIWLKEVPEYSIIFVRIILLTSICNAYASPLSVAKGATGDIKNYQIILTSLGWLHLPLAWLFFLYGFPPFYAMYIYIVLINIMQIIRIYMVCNSINFSIIEFVKNVIVKCITMLAFSFSVIALIHLNMPSGLWLRLLGLFLEFFVVAISCYRLGLTKDERISVNKFILSKISSNK